jgi:misacylated tRNA(Ala) deacylase
MEATMTELLCHSDSYLKEFDAQVVGLMPEESAVDLDRTAFFPGGGGQPCDLGWLGPQVVTQVCRKGGKILHQLEGGLPEAGVRVHGKLDWKRRYRLMRTHTAFHILCGVVWRDYGAQVTGGSMDELKGRMDFEFETLTHELVEEIEVKLNQEVTAARPVEIRVLPRAEVTAARPVEIRVLPRAEAFEIPDLIRTKINLLPEGIREVRVVEIVGLDLQADGGTHVANTREVGSVRVAGYESKGRINKRIRLEILS